MRSTVGELRILAVAVLLTTATATIGETKTEVRDFRPGGRIRVHVNVGDLHIVKGEGKQIRLSLEINPKHGQDPSRVGTTLDVRGSEANIDVHVPRNTEVDAELQVPEPSAIAARVGVGDLTVDQMQGDKDLEVGVGDIQVDLEPTPNYRSVDVSTHIGDISQRPFGEAKGLMGGHLRYNGQGQYSLHAHAGVGDVTFRSTN